MISRWNESPQKSLRERILLRKSEMRPFLFIQEDKMVKSECFEFPSIIVTSGVWASLSFKAKAVYITLGSLIDHNTNKSHLTNKVIAEFSGVCEDVVKSASDELIGEELVRRHRQGGKKIYRINKDWQVASEQPSVNEFVDGEIEGGVGGECVISSRDDKQVVREECPQSEKTVLLPEATSDVKVEFVRLDKSPVSGTEKKSVRGVESSDDSSDELPSSFLKKVIRKFGVSENRKDEISSR